jgi:hypothetical protein
MKALPPDQAAWQAVQVQAMKALEAATPLRVLSGSIFVRSYGNNYKANNCRDKHRQDVVQHWVIP